MKNEIMKVFMFKKIIPILLLVLLFACETTDDRMQIIPAVILKKVPAVYPPDAYAQNIEGWVWVRYTITENGDVINAEVTQSNSEVLFGPSAIAAIQQFKYRPRIVNGQATSINGVTYRFDFTK